MSKRPPLVWPECRTDPSIGPGGWSGWLGVLNVPRHSIAEWWARWRPLPEMKEDRK